MKLRGLIVLGLVLAFGAVKAADDSDKDKEKLQGAWQPIAAIEKGKELSKEQLKERKITFKGDKITVKHGDEVHDVTFKLDASKKPKEIDVTGKDKDDKEQLLKGIYELKGDTLKVCLEMKGGDRPNKFESSEGSEINFVTLERIKE